MIKLIVSGIIEICDRFTKCSHRTRPTVYSYLHTSVRSKYVLDPLIA